MGERKEIKPPNIQSCRMVPTMCTMIGEIDNTNLVVRRRGRHLSGVKDVVTNL